MTLLAATSSKSSSGSSTFLIFLVLIAVVGYFLLVRPQKQKARRQREQQSAVSVGDEVLTVGGIVGRVTAVDADRITILSGVDTLGFAAVGSEPTRLVLVRNAIARKLEPVTTSDAEDGADEEGEEQEGEAAETGSAHGAASTNGAGGYSLGNGGAEADHQSSTGATLPSAESEGAGS